MSCVHYKFSSKLEHNIVPFTGLHITLTELKKKIMAKERLKSRHCDLQITNAQTLEEYLDDEVHIPRFSSVIVRRLPISKVKPAGRTLIVARTETTVMESFRATANLVDANASEEDKIKAMLFQSYHEYNPINYSNKATGPPPADYTCHRCGKPGHYIHNCTFQQTQDKELTRVRTSKGIPLSFMVKTEPGTKGAMLTVTGEYVIPAIDAEAYAKGKKEHPPFVPNEQSSSEEEIDPIPDNLLCPICTELMIDAAVIPCCGNTYCDECIRTALLDSEDHVCFTCKQSDVSPDSLTANNYLRQVVNDYKNGTTYAMHMSAQVHHPALPPPPPPQLSRLHSRQQDPLKVNIPQTSTAKPAASTPPITLTTSSPAQSCRNREEHLSSRLQPVQPPAPVPPLYPSPALYGPPPQPFLPPYTSGPGLIPPPIISSQPQPVYASGDTVLNPPWGAPGSQPPLVRLPPALPQPSGSKEDFYRPRHHRMEKATSRLDEVTKGFHKDGRSYPRSPFSRRNGRSYGSSRTTSRSRSRSFAYRHSGFPQSPFSYRGPNRSRSRFRSPVGYRAHSPGGRKPPPRELPPSELKGRSPGSQDRWDRDKYRQWEKKYADSKYFKNNDNQQPSMHHKGHSSRDKERDRMTPLPRNYSVHERVRRRDDRAEETKPTGELRLLLPHPHPHLLPSPTIKSYKPRR
ncbi:E3 ubiquitin-protein ligase RBBP6-like [Gouania willdenowi]|uniref:E3 ubiquitin-protein ligase RBBP6-like n=1 Tax=Gouania willdenowi TaxID=441366 RepID=UPI001055F586|nr:E3 ubiquitin-protein ligase RBBP6-like [Gouania willdenowi]XP_028300810.1 E3 ubiquitin-protein ligase RBBP6-like [Gouania willdenowi]